MSAVLTDSVARRPLVPFVALLALALVVAMAGMAAEWDLRVLLDAGERRFALARMGEWMAAFASPDFDAGFLATVWDLTLQTLAAAIIGSLLAVVFGFILAMGASRSVTVGADVRGWSSLLGPMALFCAACRLLQDVLRAVPDFVWAVILVALIGLGPVTGALAIALNMTGILAKVYSELWDSVEDRGSEPVRATGAGRLATFFYSTRPLAARSALTFTLMRVECAVRNAAVIGAVGGGGLGAEVLYQIQFGAWERVSTLILFTLLLTLSVDLASNHLRRQWREDPNHPRPGGARRAIGRSYGALATVLAVGAWALWYMGEHLAPLGEIVRGEAWTKLAFFERLLRPDLSGDLVLRALRSAIDPLAMATFGTLIGVVGAILLGYAHSRAFQIDSSRFTGESVGILQRLLRWVMLVTTRLLAMTLRGIPEVMWVLLFIAFFGPGLVAGTLAIGLHSMGLLLRVFSESVDNLPYRRFEQAATGSRLNAFATVAAPMCWRDWLTYSFFQFEANVRMAVVLGLVGVGGLGFQFSFNFEWFRFEQASTYLLVMIGLTVIIDRLSRFLKLSRAGC
ncbi:MAG: ABC transporter permease subunit [Gammaproteobacteria bacterium]|nr:ABC transporter permease subunit [Gammaproteobacteria bacterium]